VERPASWVKEPSGERDRRRARASRIVSAGRRAAGCSASADDGARHDARGYDRSRLRPRHLRNCRDDLLDIARSAYAARPCRERRGGAAFHRDAARRRAARLDHRGRRRAQAHVTRRRLARARAVEGATVLADDGAAQILKSDPRGRAIRRNGCAGWREPTRGRFHACGGGREERAPVHLRRRRCRRERRRRACLPIFSGASPPKCGRR